MTSFTGATNNNADADFQDVGDDSYFETDNEPLQFYLDSVLPQAYDPTLEPFNTTAVNPKKYPEQNQFGFHPKPVGEYAYTVNNDDSYFTPENNYIRNN